MDVEVWWQDNYEILKGEFHKEYKTNSFSNSTLAIEFIQKELDDEIIKIIKKNPTHSKGELLKIYKMYGSDFFFKNLKRLFHLGVMLKPILKD